MTKSDQEVEKIKQLLADLWAIDIEKHKPAKNVKDYLLITMKGMFKYWHSGTNAQRVN